ncbi:MAG: ParB/RepB/Spo0J family partition protein [Oscillospiraceae bacterium]|nr:ParB/RepB/Spo0J family partition protein [Oscillospiraceae bacterium]
MKETRAEHLAVDKLRPFDGHPFKVVDNEEMDQLVWSILTQGLLTPLVVRPLPNGEYEVISGHRRLHACKKAGIETVPALIYAIDRDAAAIALVDSNLQREHILPSEKAFAYKLKLEAMNHQGRTSGQVGQKWTRDEIAEGESGRQVQRYIRLTNLIPGILQKVDEGRIALTPAVELSYLADAEQEDLLETMESEDCTPSLSQAIQMKALSQSGQLDMDKIFSIMTQPKANQQEKISFKVAELRDFFPRHYTAAQMMQEIKVALKERQQRLARQRDHSR